jgi:hypothetical protein
VVVGIGVKLGDGGSDMMNTVISAQRPQPSANRNVVHSGLRRSGVQTARPIQVKSIKDPLTSTCSIGVIERDIQIQPVGDANHRSV